MTLRLVRKSTNRLSTRSVDERRPRSTVTLPRIRARAREKARIRLRARPRLPWRRSSVVIRDLLCVHRCTCLKYWHLHTESNQGVGVFMYSPHSFPLQ